MIKRRTLQKAWAILGIFLMVLLNFGPFFNYLKFPDHAKANASTTWTKSNSNPVINNNSAGYPQVIKDGDTYKMWVEANGGNNFYTTSSDGTTWASLQNLKNESNANFNAHEATVIKDGSTYKMWYNKVTDGTGYRESVDGINWGSEQIVTYDVTKAWDRAGGPSVDRICPFVFKDGDTYKMYYNANEGAGKYYIAYATSTNGTSWTEPQNLGQVQDATGSTNNNLVLKQGSAGAWDGFQGAGLDNEALYQMHVLKNTGGTYEMWYGGNQNGWDSAPYYQIGYATALDGTTWTKSGSNPVLSSGTWPDWDAVGVFYPSVIEDGSTYKMWFTSGDWTGNVGYATAPTTTVSPQTASVTSPAGSTYYKAANMPSSFSGQAADGAGGTGLNADSTVFYLERTSDNHYWDGSDWDATTAEWLATTHSATTDSSAVTWTDNVSLPAWSSGTTYKSAAKVTNKTSQTLTGTEITFYYDSVVPQTASVTTPVNGTTYNIETMPSTFSGSIADDASGLGMAANSTTFYIKNVSNQYWTGLTWSDIKTWLITTHDATTDGTSKTWSDNIILPSWSSGTYYVGAKAVDRAANALEGTEISFIYSNTGAEVSYSMNKFYDVYNSTNWPDAISGTATGTDIDNVYVKIERYTDSYYWNGSDWVATDPGWQSATGTTTWSYSFPHSNLGNAHSYRISAYAHDDNGDGTTNIGLFMYNSLDWTQYRINPVTSGTNFANTTTYPNVIKDGSTYKMWSSFGTGIYYSTSTNGINWVGGNNANPVLQPGSSGTWDDYYVIEPWVVKDGSTYKMWYSASSGTADMKIGYATSSDGITWTKSASNPVLDIGAGSAWDNRSIRKPVVIKDDSTYKMWYNGTQGDNTAYNIGYATSSDGVTWTKYGSSPVIERSDDPSAWDYSNIWAMSVLKRGDGQYEMYYSGNGAAGSGLSHQIGYAYSASGVIWFKYGSNPVIGPGSSGTWNDNCVYTPMIITEGYNGSTIYKMWYNGDDGDTTKLGYATMDAPADSTKPVSDLRFDLSEDSGWMNFVNETYYSGPIIFSDTYALRGDASDSWGVEKVESTLQGNDGKYWDGDSWENSATWLNSASTDGFVSWNYSINDSNFSDTRTYTLQSKATDGSQTANAQTSFGSSSFTWDSTDATAILTQIGGATPKTYYNSDLFSIVSGTASDATSGVYEVDLALKRSSDSKYWRYGTETWEVSQYWDDATGTTSWTYSDIRDSLKNTIRNGGDGVTYTIYTAGVDNVYNNYDLSSSATTQFIYDGTKPSSSPSMARNYYKASNWPVPIIGTASDATSGVASVQIKIKNTTDNTYWTGETWGAETWINATGTTSWNYNLVASNLTSGKSYTIYSKATDNAENAQTSFGEASFGYDTATPTTSAVYDGTNSGVETSEVESLTTLSANWTASTSEGGSDISYEYAIGTTSGGTDIVSWTSTGTDRTITKSGLSLTIDQTYYFSVRATNGAGTTGTAGNSSGQTVIDHTPPVVALTSYPSDPTSSNTPAFIGTSIDAMSNISTVEFKVDNGDWSTVWSEAQSGDHSKSINFSHTSSALSNGSHTVYFKSTDVKNNTSSAISYSFTVDTEVPSAPNITYPSSGEIISSSTPTITGTAEANSTILLTLSSDIRSYSTITDGNGNWSYTIPSGDTLSSGEHTLSARARDNAGNTSTTSTISFTIAQSVVSTVSEVLTTAKEVSKSEVSVISQEIKIPIGQKDQEVQILISSQFSLSIKPGLSKEIKTVIAVFDGNTYNLVVQPDGSYLTTLFAPAQKGTYSAVATVTYKDGTTEEIGINVLVDPYGYVYEKKKAGEQHLEGAVVTLYVYKDNKWIIWDGINYNNQKNPQTTLANGEYGFMVPEGKYYLSVEKEGYKDYKSQEISVAQGQPINLNIELVKKTNYWLWIILGLLLVASVTVYFYSRKKR